MLNMDTVVAFNNELSGLYDSRPPISKAKMAAITKSAMRAIKFYKHVVQSVEKFILKCKPEYKVPGLYVIDSIVRQSRHQYGTEKDVFAPRFQRNLTETFANLFRCAPEDKSRIIRVLNLWQKNNVFKSDVIQPIFDLADPNHPIYHQMQPVSRTGVPVNVGAGTSSSSGALSLVDISSSHNGLNQAVLSSLEMSMNSGESHIGDDKGGVMPDLSVSHEKCSRCIHENIGTSSSRRHIDQHYIKCHHVVPVASSSKSRASIDTGVSKKRSHYLRYSKSSHEYEYDAREMIGEEDEDMLSDDHHFLGGESPPTSSNLLDVWKNNNLKQLLNDPNVLRQLQTLQNFQKIKQQEENQLQQHFQNVLKGNTGIPPGIGMSLNEVADLNKDVEFISEQQTIEVINLDGGDSRSPTPERERYKRTRRSSRSRTRSPRDRGGRSGAGVSERDRNSRRRTSRSRSRSRSPRSSRRRNSRDRDREPRTERNTREKERDRERRKKGLSDIKKEHLSVCSTTLWVGHLSKLVYQEELSDTFGEYGDIVSIDQIVPRGCAFIVMNRRQDAHRAMQALKSHKLQGRAITISWAAGKGVKSKEWKDFWDLELGVTYIPWNKLSSDTDFDSLEEGGMFDEDTMPVWMKDKINQTKNAKDNKPTSGTTSVPSELSGSLSTAPPALLFGIDTTQPPPVAPQHGGSVAPPPPLMGMIPGQFPMAPPMGGPPPRMLGPMGTMNPMPGLPIPPNMVPGMPPPMMMPPTIMPPGFPGISGPPHPISLPPGSQFHPGGTVPPPLAAGSNMSNDDQMDIEMELEDTPTQPNFNQPPPMFVPGGSAGTNNTETGGCVTANDMFQRERGRGVGSISRWGGRDSGNESVDRWRGENGSTTTSNVSGGLNEVRGRLSLGSVELSIQQRPDFMNVDFDNRAGSRGIGSRTGNHNGNDEFFQPIMGQNRFNQPTSLMQMRIPPPVAYNQRMASGNAGGGSMFMRNQGGSGPSVGRQQGPGFFNARNPFNDSQRGRGSSRGMGGSIGGRGRWSDDEDDGNTFKRRGGMGSCNNRFRERENSADRRVGNMRGRGSSRDERERDTNKHGSRDETHRNSISSTDEPARKKHSETIDSMDMRIEHTPTVTEPSTSTSNNSMAVADTEEDWDLELQEYDAQQIAEKTVLSQPPAEIEPSASKSPAFLKPLVEAIDIAIPQSSPVCTPLYDELPPATTHSVELQSPQPHKIDTSPTIQETPAPVPESPACLADNPTASSDAPTGTDSIA